MAVPTILGGMVDNSEIQVIPGLQQWHYYKIGNLIANDLNNLFEKLALVDRLYFAHPVKVTTMDKKRYCQIIIERFWIGGSLEDVRKAFPMLLNIYSRS